MGSMRFRRSMKIAPGLRLNVNKRSVGLSAGGRGARVSINSSGRSTRSIGIPGTGLSYRSQTGPGGSGRAPDVQALPPEMRPSRVLRRIVLWGLVAIGVLLALNGNGGAGGGFIAAGIVAWVVFWALGGVVDWLVFTWLGRRRGTATAEEPVDAQRLAAQIATATVPSSAPVSRTSDDSDEVELSPANVAPRWREGDAWLTWEPPRDFIAGESHYMPALRELTGEPREGGYLIPVDIAFVREPTNPYDTNAWRAEVDGRLVGHARSHLAAQFSIGLDDYGITTFTLCGLIRGGALDTPNLVVHVWPGRRPSPGPELQQVDDALAVPWPPTAEETRNRSNDQEHPPGQGEQTTEERLARLKDLRDRGVISDDEYSAQRAAIIKQL